METEFSNVLRSVFPHLIPEMILVGAASAIFLGGAFRTRRHLWNALSLLAVLVAMLVFLAGGSFGPGTSGPALFAGPVLFDQLAFLMKIIAFGTGIVLVLFSWHEVPKRQSADHQACLLIVIAGLSIAGAANDLVTLFLALEMISIPVYILLYLPRFDEASQEAALKYFMLSVFSSGLLLFGFSYLYGLAGSTNIAAIMQTLNQGSLDQVGGLAAVALIMIVAGLGFRITAVPFHFYAPDVYQGAPTVLGALLAFVQKAAGFVALLRVLGFVLPEAIAPRGGQIGMALGDHLNQVPILLWFVAAVTMFLGNVLGLLQDNVKRLLAYSSIAHAGYMLVALAVAPFLRHTGAAAGPDGIEALLFYLVAYGAMTVGAFAVLSYLSTPQRQVETMDDLAGLSATHPGIALFMTIFLFSLIGIPFTAGFTGKLLIIFGALGVPPGDATTPATLFRILAALTVINAAIGAWYYLRIIAMMYLRTSLRPLENQRTWPGLATLWLCAILTIGLSLPPGSDWLLKASREATGVSPGPNAVARR
jgi:NADH-quinone oxidoreductase subunit N